MRQLTAAAMLVKIAVTSLVATAAVRAETPTCLYGTSTPAPSAGPVAVRIGVSPARVSGEVIDGGKPFDPSLERQSTAAEGVGRAPGGLGLLLVRRLTEGLVYERVGERNRTTFSICRAAD